MEKKEPVSLPSPQASGIVATKTSVPKPGTASDKMKATYIERPWSDAKSLIECLNANIFARRETPLRTRFRRVINIEIYDSQLAYFNFTYAKSHPWQKLFNPRRPCDKYPEACQKVGIDYDLESDEELAELQGEDVENEDQDKSCGTVEEAQDEEGNDIDLIEEGFIIRDEDAFSEDEEPDSEKQQRNQRMKTLEQHKKAMF